MPDDRPTLRTATGVRNDLIRMAAAPAVDRSTAGVYAADSVLDLRRADPDGEGESEGGDGGLGTLVGYPIVFDTWTEINSWWEGRFLERIDPAAVDVTLARRGDRVRVLLNHGMDPQVGDKPLGKPRTQEPDTTGMWAETPLSDTSYNRDLAALIRDGALDGQSFRFTVAEERWTSYADGDERPDYNPDGIDERTILRLNLQEHGPVTFPAYEATTLGLRSAAEVAAWRAGDHAVRSEMIVGVAARVGVRDIDPDAVLQRMDGSRGVDDGPPEDTEPPEATSATDDDSDTSRTDDPRSPGRTTERQTATPDRRAIARRLAARAGAAYREIDRP